MGGFSEAGMGWVLAVIFVISIQLVGANKVLAEELSLKMDDIEVVTANLPPWSLEDSADQPGVLRELVAMLNREAGISPEIPTRILPWKRAQAYAASRNNVLIFPMMRTSGREGKFSWVQQVDRLDTLFVSMDGSKIDLDSARGLSLVTVRLGTPMQNFLISKGFNNLLISPSTEIQLSLLEKKRVSAWYVSEPLARFAAAKRGLKELTFGPKVTSSPVYIAASKNFPDPVMERYRLAYHSLSESGEVRALWERYFGSPPKLY